MAELPTTYEPKELSDKGYTYNIVTPRENGQLYVYGKYNSLQSALDHSPINGLTSYIAKYKGDGSLYENFRKALYKWSNKKNVWKICGEDDQLYDEDGKPIFVPNAWEKRR